MKAPTTTKIRTYSLSCIVVHLYGFGTQALLYKLGNGISFNEDKPLT